MKICFLTINYSDIGGLERVLSLVSSDLSNKEDITLISMYDTKKICPYVYNPKVKKIILFPNQKKNYIKHLYSSINKIKEVISNNHFDYLIYLGEILSPYAYFATQSLNIKTICWMHTPAFAYDYKIIQRFLRPFSLKHAYYTVTLTNASKNELISKYKLTNIKVIPNPIDPLLIKQITYQTSSKKILSVGRICYAKYYEKLIEVANIVLKNNPGWTWDVYGDGKPEDKAKLQNLIDTYKLTDKLFLKGNTDDMYSLYSNYSIQVMTSRYEGFPMTLLEGLANGIPLVAFDIKTGPNEIIENNINGYLIKPFDIDEMASSIDKLINNEKLRNDISNNNLHKRELFNISNISKEWIDFLKNI